MLKIKRGCLARRAGCAQPLVSSPGGCTVEAARVKRLAGSGCSWLQLGLNFSEKKKFLPFV